jgi:hypothetical protein
MELVYRLWAEAGMPAAEKVSQSIAEAPLAGSASKETVRKMLTGKTVPQTWENAEAVFVVLSQMAGIDPDRLVRYLDDVEDYEPYPGPEPARTVFRRLWYAARGMTEYAHGSMEDYKPPQEGAWRAGGFSDEPPF